MKRRILTNWSITRILYVFIGVVIIIQSVMNQQWIGVVLGGYFASMGLFSYGCAAGNCFGSTCTTMPQKKTKEKEIDFEEIK